MNMLERAARAQAEAGGFDPDEMMANGGPRWRYYVPTVRAVLAAIREPDEATASRAIDIAYEAENAMSGETCPVMRNHIRSYVDAILEGESK